MINPTVDFPTARRSSLIYSSLVFLCQRMDERTRLTRLMTDEKIGVPRSHEQWSREIMRMERKHTRAGAPVQEKRSL